MPEPTDINRRFLEDSFPIKEVSREAAKEKTIRHGHISTLHIWWARRPIVASRATNYAALIPSPKPDERAGVKDFIIELAKWKNSNNSNLLSKAKKDILNANKNTPPRVLDPFAGGGSLPLEALRLGCDTFASDYNPVSVLLLKCTLEYPQKFCERKSSILSEFRSTSNKVSCNSLHLDVKKWGLKVLDEVKEELDRFYPRGDDESTPVGYLWARTVPCNNSSCGAVIPLMRGFWLANRGDTKIALFPYVIEKKVKFKIVGTGYEKLPHNFNPSKGTVSKAIAVCPVCGSTTDAQTLKLLFRKKLEKQKLIAIVTRKPGESGKNYRVADENDENIINEVESYLGEKQRNLYAKWGFDPIPDEIIATPTGKEYVKGGLLYNFTPTLLYGMTRWRDLFNSRQKLALVTFVEKVRKAHDDMLRDGLNEEYAKAITSYLALAIDRQADYNSRLCIWLPMGEFIGHTFARQALPMVWDYFELFPWSEATGDWNSALNWILRVIMHCSELPPLPAKISKSSASALPYVDNYFDAIFTDPPYYDNVPYSTISDYFYVWLKRTIGHLYPELFATPLSPKTEEIIDDLSLLRGISKDKADSVQGTSVKTKADFERMLTKAFSEIGRVLKPEGVAVIVYAHRSTSGWEVLINSLLDSGLVVTAAWPINTEMQTRMRAHESAVLGSSIYIMVRKISKSSVGIYKNVKEELLAFLNEKMDLLWKEGISGADFFISAIGASVQIFGKYGKIMREDSIIRADVMLDDVRRIVTDYAVKQVLHNGFDAEISNLTRFYLLWRWSFGEAIIPFDDARKLSQSTVVDLPHEWSRPNGFIKKQKEFVGLLGPQDRNIEEISSVDKKDLIDILHIALLLWQKGDHPAIIELLSETGFGNKDSFYRVAQAISETLPRESQEKKLIEGFLAGKERLSSETKKINVQKRLFE